MGADNTTIKARRGEMVLNANQQRQLFEIANGGSTSSFAASLAAALQAMPAPVLVLQELNDFQSRTASITNNQTIK